MSIDEQHIALPKLYGAPAYARPATVADVGPKPFDPDELPIEAFQTEIDREFAATLPAEVWAPGGVVIEGLNGGDRTDAGHDAHSLRGRPFSLRTIAGRLLGGD